MSLDSVELGRSGIRISPIGLGCWQFSAGRGLAGSFWPAIAQETVNAIVAEAMRAGITWFDTAEVYGNGASEEALRVALGAAPRSVDAIVATKWRPFLRTARSIVRTYAERENLLSPFPITLHQIHAPASFSSIEAEMNAMADLVEQGRLQAVGVSNFSARQMVRADEALQRRGLRLASNQVRYSLLDRRIEHNGTLAAARERGITIIAYSPLGQGILTGRFHRDPDALARVGRMRRMMPGFSSGALQRVRPLMDVLEGVAQAAGATPAQVTLAWTIRRHAPHLVAIPGASSIAQVTSNAGAMRLDLDEEAIERIDEASREVVDRGSNGYKATA